mmetsp:Transcript_1628/g.5548  ORF Transcript_1628/g.5548 Transcript_1628/m.5548 type:complete len:216 (-) Transcript_1628:59-706(-)
MLPVRYMLPSPLLCPMTNALPYMTCSSLRCWSTFHLSSLRSSLARRSMSLWKATLTLNSSSSLAPQLVRLRSGDWERRPVLVPGWHNLGCIFLTGMLSRGPARPSLLPRTPRSWESMACRKLDTAGTAEGGLSFNPSNSCFTCITIPPNSAGSSLSSSSSSFSQSPRSTKGPPLSSSCSRSSAFGRGTGSKKTAGSESLARAAGSSSWEPAPIVH